MAATQRTIVISLENSNITKKGDKVALSYKEVEIKTIYLDLKTYGSDFSKNDRVMLEVVETENQDGTKRIQVVSLEKL